MCSYLNRRITSGDKSKEKLSRKIEADNNWGTELNKPEKACYKMKPRQLLLLNRSNCFIA